MPSSRSKAGARRGFAGTVAALTVLLGAGPATAGADDQVPGAQSVSAVVAASESVNFSADGTPAPSGTTGLHIARRREGDTVITTITPAS